MDPRPTSFTVTWVGHATVLVEVGGFRLITDPALRPRLAHLRRRTATPAVDAVDAVLVSHVHLDHLHVPSLRSVAPGAEVVVPRGAAPLLTKLDPGSLTEVAVGDRVSLDGGRVEVEVVHAHHLHGRGPHSRVEAHPVGYVVRSGGRAVYFAGDTDLFPEMRDLGPLDVALLPIWGWGPSLGERHLDPSRAATATEWIDPRRVVPIHWGTYTPMRLGRGAPAWIHRPIGEFRDALGELGLAERLTVLEPGGSLVLA